ncbi:MAG TPA: hypothetical protein VGH36_12630, partial [Acetobacteraceae bacterium]
MFELFRWLVAIAAVLLLCTPGMAPAQARGSVHGTGVARVPPATLQRHFNGPRIVAHPLDRRNEFLRHRGLNGGTAAVWPDPWFPYSASDPAAIEAPSPSLIVLSNAAGDPPDHSTPATLPDYSYVPGCHAIP